MRGNAVLAVLLLIVFGAAVVLFVVSGEGPQVQFAAPQEGTTVTGTVEITGVATGGAQIAGVKVRVDAGDWMAATITNGNETRTAWTASWNSTTVPDGPHKLTANAWDVAEQTGERTISVYVANPPWARIVSPMNGTTTNGIVTISGVSGDPTVGDAVELVQVSIDPTPTKADWQNATPIIPDWSQWSYGWNTTSLVTGAHVVAARAFDGSLYSAPSENEYVVDNRPFVRLVHPRGNITPLDIVHGHFLVHGTAGYLDGGNRIELVQVRIDSGAWINATDTSLDASWSSWAYQWNSTEYADGSHEVCARAWDGSQYSEAVCARANVNNGCGVPPTIEIGDPVEGQTVRGLVLVHGNASGYCCGVWLVQVSIDHDAWSGATDTSPDGSYTTWAKAWDTRGWEDGCLDVSARAWDGTMFSDVETITVCIDNLPHEPVVTFENLTNGQTVKGLYLFHGFTGDVPGVQLVQIRFDEDEWLQATNTGRTRVWSSWAFEWNTTAVPNGAHEVCVRSLDGELYSEPACLTIHVDNSPAGTYAMTMPELLQASLLGLGLPSWLSSILLWLLSAGYVPVVIVSIIPALLLWLRSHGYLRK